MGAYSRWVLIRGWALIRINIYSSPTNLSYVLICIKETESLNPIMSLSQETLSNGNNIAAVRMIYIKAIGLHCRLANYNFDMYHAFLYISLLFWHQPGCKHKTTIIFF